LIPDLIEVGVNILNPVQVNAANMDSARLKAEFGNDIVFWGGAVDPQGTLNSGSPDQVYMETRRNIDNLAKDGGFVFAAVHNIQPNVPPHNIMAMWQALQDHRY
jgi:uroporphyrinogen decarboxylase